MDPTWVGNAGSICMVAIQAPTRSPVWFLPASRTSSVHCKYTTDTMLSHTGAPGGRWRANFRKTNSSSQEMIQEDKQKYLKRSQADLGPCGPVMKDRRGQNLSPAQLPTNNTRILRAQGCTDRSAGYSEGCAISRFGAALYTPFVEVDLRST